MTDTKKIIEMIKENEHYKSTCKFNQMLHDLKIYRDDINGIDINYIDCLNEVDTKILCTSLYDEIKEIFKIIDKYKN